MLKKCASRIYLFLMFAFLYLPIVVLIVLSFNDSRSKVKWGGFTFRWYTGCFQDEKIMAAFATTLQVTFLSAIISTLIGTLAAIGFFRPLLESPVLKPAFDNIMAALMGALGLVYISKNWKLAIAPLTFMIVLFLLVPSLASSVGILVPVGALIAIGAGKILQKKNLL